MSTRRILLPGLCFVVMTLAVLQTMVVPIVGTIGTQLGVSTTAAGWVLTANLLAAVIATPVIGRLADLHGKRPVLVGVLTVVLAGSMLAALTDSLLWLLVGRVLQGVSYALFPIALAVLRDEMPPAKLVGSMAILSGTLGVGGGFGLVLTGLLTANGADYHRVFWLTVAFVVVALAIAWFGVPSRPRTSGGSVDWWGAALLAVTLLLLFLALTQGRTWGWGSVATIGCAVVGVLVGTIWWVFENRTDEPLVAPRMLTHGPLLATNVATLFVGVGMFVNFLACSFFVQTPRAVAGYGFTANVLEASVVYLLPGAAVGVVAAVVSGRLIRSYGPRRVLVAGALIGLIGFVFVALAHDRTWQLITAGIVINLFVSLAFAALPNLLMAEVSAADTGVANSVNSIVRTVGTSIASATLSTVLAMFTIDGTTVAREIVYTAAFLTGAAACAVVALAALAIKSTPPDRESTVVADSESTDESGPKLGALPGV
ncbi:MFS transporter [Rhodococcus sp. 05-340-1]|jgi:MFS family permease|uniref:MFS transporter n=1 Tax=Nocardiaceae TaxID=85025 RepID=UPI000566252A|nr:MULTISPECIES: MFS transporter [Rhodococcus]OZD67887.1 MFS transporter [Rhodococcus sp. 05-340-2]OZD84845.1 MFS transporter [Rhodococcus sp. 05-340-1]OZF03090.1 MFS transporter [Rhodococcus sp. 15-2388-1-1a]OZF03115.1 MFS transporter [Rhodococcus sp. 15-2388-1-1a]